MCPRNQYAVHVVLYCKNNQNFVQNIVLALTLPCWRFIPLYVTENATVYLIPKTLDNTHDFTASVKFTFGDS